MWFNIDFYKLIQLLIPSFLRQPILKGFLKSIGAGLNTIHYKLTLFKSRIQYELEHNSQVCRLRKVLNDRFDDTLRGIKITEGYTHERLYIYTFVEQQPKFLPLFVHQSTEYSDTALDFIVTLPNYLNLSLIQTELEALINSYKLASKRYKIEYE